MIITCLTTKKISYEDHNMDTKNKKVKFIQAIISSRFLTL